MIRMRSAMLAVGLLACLAVPVAAGLWTNFPQVGVASHCSSTNQPGGPGTATNCTVTTPAGPTSVTGSETIPADTNQANGAAPQTVIMGMANLNALPVTVRATIASGVNVISATGLQGGLVLTHTSTITSLALSLPPTPVDGQQFALTANQTVTTVVVSGTGSDTVDSAPTVITRSTTGTYGYTFMYNKAATKWYRLK